MPDRIREKLKRVPRVLKRSFLVWRKPARLEGKVQNRGIKKVRKRGR